MNIDRNKVVEQLEHTRTYVKNPDLSIADDARVSLNGVLDQCIRYAKYGRYHVTTLGVFSTGKSTLLNAMLEDKILPAADLPVTAITTEIYYSDKTSFFIPMKDVSDEILSDFQHGIDLLKGRTNVSVVNSLARDGEKVSGVGGILETHDSTLINTIITELTSQQKRAQEPFLLLKNELDSNHDLTLWLGVSTVPDWLRDIVLTDAPGTGSIDDCHEIIINKVIPESQLVLYLIESTRAGSAIDKRFCDRVSNTYHRKIFYILNKIDQQNNDERADALDCARRCVPDVAPGGERPEFLSVAGLYALIAHELVAGKMSIKDVFTDAKINLNMLLIKDEWHKADEVGKSRMLAEYLLANSQFTALRNRIEQYLNEENKELAIAQQANAAIVNVATKVVQRCDNALRILNSNCEPEELLKKKEDLHGKRCGYEREADRAINDYKCKALDHAGLGTTISGWLAPIANEIACELKTTLENNSENYKNLQKKEALEKWVKKELGRRVEDVVRNTDNELQKSYAHLLEQLLPILKKIEEGSLASTLSSIKVQNTFSSDTTNAPQVVGSVLGTGLVLGSGAWAMTALGIGVTTTTVGTGTAGFLAAHGCSWLATTAAGWGWGTLGTSTTIFGCSAAGLFIPVIGVGVAAATLVALFCFGKNWKVEKIVSKTKELLEKIVLTGGTIDKTEIVPVATKMREAVETAINGSAQDLRERIKIRLRQIDEEEAQLLKEFNEKKESRQKKVEKIIQLKSEIEQIAADAQNALNREGI